MGGRWIEMAWAQARQGKEGGEEEIEIETGRQGQYVVSDTRCPALSDCELE